MVEERYEIRGKIGQGGVGAVYKAYDTQLRREVAIKRVLSDELDMNNETATKNLLQEATALSSVQHPHICTVYDAGLDDEGPFVVMELINGKTLDEMVERGTLTYADFREVAIQSQEAMIAAQELKLVHRDLKPSNVMVSWLPSGRFQVKLVDFGLAKFSPKPSLQTIDHGDSVFGSIFFMAPEQFERIELDQRTDMYSLGAMFYFTLAGVYPFNGETAPQVMAAHLQHSVHPLHELRPDLPQWLCDWVMWHIQKDMDHRPESARVALERFLADEAGALHTMSGTQQQAAAPAPLLTPATTQVGPSNATSPQPIISPSGSLSPSTSPIAIQPAGAIHTGQVAATATAPNEIQAQTQATNMQLLQKQGMNKKLVIGVCAALALGIGGISVALFGAGENNERNEKYNTLTEDVERRFKAREIRTFNKDQLDVIFSVIKDPKSTENKRTGGYYLLSLDEAENDVFSPPLETAVFATSEKDLSDETRGSLFRAVALNPEKNLEAHEILLDYAVANPNKKHSAEAIKRMKEFADDTHLDKILDVFEKTEELNSKAICSETIAAIAKRSNSKNLISNILTERYKAAEDKSLQLAYLRILGITGSQASLKTLTDALKSSNGEKKVAASKGLAKFPTIDPFPYMLAVFAAENKESTNKSYRSHIFELLADKNVSDSVNVKNWYDLIAKAPTVHSRKMVVGRVAIQKSSWAIEVLNKVASNPSFDTETKNFSKNKLTEWGN